MSVFYIRQQKEGSGVGGEVFGESPSFFEMFSFVSARFQTAWQCKISINLSEYFQGQKPVCGQRDLCLFNKGRPNVHLSQSGRGLKP